MKDYDTVAINGIEYAVNPIITEALLTCCSDKIKLVEEADIVTGD